jgi:hypothetical protein
MLTVLGIGVLSAGTWFFGEAMADPHHGKNSEGKKEHRRGNVEATFQNAAQMVVEGQQTFRFDTYGDEAFWGDTLQLHRAIEGAPSAEWVLELVPRQHWGWV